MANPATTLHPFQLEGVKHLKGRSACLFDEPGLGKTVMSIYANVDASDTGPVLVITPLRNKIFFAASILHWTEVYDLAEARTQSPANEPVVVVAETAGRFDVQEFHDAVKLRRRTWLITHWAALHEQSAQELANVVWSSVIVDEAHRMRNRDTKQTAFVQYVLRAQHFHFLTATPQDKHPGELWPMLYRCDPVKFRSYWKFFGEFVETKNMRFGSQSIATPVGVKNPKALARVLKPLVLQRRKADVAPQLPPVRTTTVDINLNGLTDTYEKLERQSYIEAQREGAGPLYISNQLARIIRLQQLTSLPALIGFQEVSPKREWLQDFIEGVPLGCPVLVFTKYRETARHLALNLPHATSVVGGDTFNGWPKSVSTLCVTYGTLSEGVNLDRTTDGRVVSYVVFYDLQYSHIVNEQSIHRVHRITTNLPVNVYQLCAVRASGKHTVDHDILDALDHKAGDSGLVQSFLRRIQDETR